MLKFSAFLLFLSSFVFCNAVFFSPFFGYEVTGNQFAFAFFYSFLALIFFSVVFFDAQDRKDKEKRQRNDDKGE